jgi:hypothetical protein
MINDPSSCTFPFFRHQAQAATSKYSEMMQIYGLVWDNVDWYARKQFNSLREGSLRHGTVNLLLSFPKIARSMTFDISPQIQPQDIKPSLFSINQDDCVTFRGLFLGLLHSVCNFVFLWPSSQASKCSRLSFILIHSFSGSMSTDKSIKLR